MLRNKYLAVFLSIVAIIVVYFSLVRGFILKKQVRPAVKKPAVAVNTEAPEVDRGNWDLNSPFKIEQISYNTSEEWGRDIFIPGKFEGGQKVLLPAELPRLSAIVRDNKRVFAILNGQIVKEGDRIDGILVKRILTNSVIIDRGAGEEYVYIFNLQKGGQFEENK